MILTLAVAGIILIAVSYIWDEQPEPVTVSDATGSTLTEDARQLEERLTEIIGQVAGAGETCVMVTMDTTRESVYAEDITSQRRSTQTGELGSGDETSRKSGPMCSWEMAVKNRLWWKNGSNRS